MEFIYDKVSSYLDGHDAIYNSLSQDDFRIIASSGPSSSVIKVPSSAVSAMVMQTNRSLKFLKLILLVLLTPPNVYMVNQMSTLPQKTQIVLETLIREIDPAQSSFDEETAQATTNVKPDHANSNHATGSSLGSKVDRELELEAQLAQVQSLLDRRTREVERLEAEKDDLNDVFSRLTESYEAVKKQSEEQDDQLRKFTSAHDDMEQLSVRELETKISHQEEIISGQNIQITEQQANKADTQRKLDKLNSITETLQRLQDEYHIQAKDLEYQTKKANAGEKYKQKVLVTQAVEKERDSLRQQLESVLPKIKAYDELRRDNARLIKENRETISTLEQSERGNNELRETKQVIVVENSRLQRELKVLREAYARGQERLADFDERSSSSDIHSSPTIVDGGLESELAITSKNEEQMQVANTLLWWTRGLMIDRKSRIMELENYTRDLAEAANEKEMTASLLQQKLNNAYDQLTNTSAVYQGHSMERSVSPAVNMVNSAHDTGSSETFMQLQDQLKEEKVKCNLLEEQLSTAHRNLETATDDRTFSFERHCMMSELSIDLLEGEFVGKSESELVEAVKKQNAMPLMQLQSQHDALQRRHKSLQEEFNTLREERNQAWRESHEAVVAKAEGDAKFAANNRSLDELSLMIQKASTNISPNSKSSIQTFASKVIQETRERLAQGHQVDKMLPVTNGTPLTPIPSPLPLTVPSVASSPGSSHTSMFSKKFFGPEDADKI